VAGTFENVGLVLLHPDDLRRGESGQRVVACGLNQVCEADSLADQIAFRAATLIVPENRRAQHVAFVIEQNQPVHLAGQANGGNILTTGIRFVERLANARGDGLPPIFGVLL
jgi:hypothetical protein